MTYRQRQTKFQFHSIQSDVTLFGCKGRRFFGRICLKTLRYPSKCDNFPTTELYKLSNICQQKDLSINQQVMMDMTMERFYIINLFLVYNLGQMTSGVNLLGLTNMLHVFPSL